ncbi:MAG: hypothetical protein IJX86_02595 [Lachnospiraceae bacterium]|nr:hypothetical protein [Lachnospiraceae bacterium]
MKKKWGILISMAVVVLVCLVAFPHFSKAEGETVEVSVWEYVNEYNQNMIIMIEESDSWRVGTLFENNILIQKAQLNKENRYMTTDLYSLESGKPEYSGPQRKVGDIDAVSIYKNKSNVLFSDLILENADLKQLYNTVKSSDSDKSIIRETWIFKPNVDVSSMDISVNTVSVTCEVATCDLTYVKDEELVSAGEYEFIKSAGGCLYAPALTGELYQKTDIYSHGKTEYNLDKGASIIDIAVLIYEAYKKDVESLLVSLVELTKDKVAARDQRIYLETYTYVNRNRVDVQGVTIIENGNSYTYWHGYNMETGAEQKMEKSFNGGYVGDLDELIVYAIGVYYNDYHVPNHKYSNHCDTTCDICGGPRNASSHEYSSPCDESCNECGELRSVAGHEYDNACDILCNKCGNIRTVPGHGYYNACATTCYRCGYVRSVSGHEYSNACDATCNKCGAARSVSAHVYSNGCDTTCNVCGVTRSVSGHVYSNACDPACNNCGVNRSVSGHAYSNGCDTTCNTCGATRSVSGHTYSNGCDTTCNTCGVTRSVSGHTYSNGCDTTCNVCGATRSVQGHSYSNGCDTTCNKCGSSRSVSGHSYDNACDVSCNICGASRSVSGHKYSSICDSSCNVCGATRSAAAHSYTAYRANGGAGHYIMCVRCATIKQFVSHSYTLINQGHVGTQHQFSKRCTTCGYTYTYRRTCSGSPHVVS